MGIGDQYDRAAEPGFGAAPARGPDCPSWCGGHHQDRDDSATGHSRVVARHDNATVALSCITYPGQAQASSTVILVDLGTATGPAELEESDAIRLLGAVQAGEGPPWLADVLRTALDLLDPEAGWVRSRLPASPSAG